MVMNLFDFSLEQQKQKSGKLVFFSVIFRGKIHKKSF